jgi:hypothetical protein
MENFKETEKRITSAMIEISNIIKSNEMSALCLLYKKQGSIIATPTVITGSPTNIIPAIVRIMQNSSIARNIILTACDYYKYQEKEKIETKEIPQYLRDFIEELFNEL